jgi:hypothetical protein
MGEIHIQGHVPITGDCGHQFDVSIAGLSTETDLVCPECGAIDHLSDEQIGGINDQLNAAIRNFGVE